MKTQTPITPPVSDCYCGKKAIAIDWEFRDRWQVICDSNHTLTKECGSRHRAVCRWNNRVSERKRKLKLDSKNELCKSLFKKMLTTH